MCVPGCAGDIDCRFAGGGCCVNEQCVDPSECPPPCDPPCPRGQECQVGVCVALPCTPPCPFAQSCQSGVCGRAPGLQRLPSMHSYQGTVFSDSEMGDIESEEMQGIAQSPSHWYWISRYKIERVPIGSSILSPVDARVSFPSAFSALGYDHFGDGDVFGDRLFVPITRSGLVPVVLVYDLDLNLIAWGTLPQGGGGWVAVNPLDGHLYSSDPYTTLRTYDISHLTPISANPASELATAGLGYIGHVELELNFDLPKTCPDRVPLVGDVCAIYWSNVWNQGGDFSPNGVFYYVLDHATADHNNNTGVHVFDVTPFPPGTQPSPDGVAGPLAHEVVLEGDGSGYLNLGYDATASVLFVDIARGDELEGITVDRGGDGLIHVHLIKLTNEDAWPFHEDDDVTLYRWLTNER
jgi:hypothetical protein